jgi:hypothetical protein
METGSVIKLVLAALLTLAVLAVWLLPRTRLAGRRVGERLFVATCWAGVLSGAAGLVVTFAWPGHVFEWHLWELAAMPLVLMYFCWIVVMRRAGTTAVLDEKQDFDMTRSGAITCALLIPAMLTAFLLHGRGLFDGALWFPYYLFVTLLVNSGGALYFFKRG